VSRRLASQRDTVQAGYEEMRMLTKSSRTRIFSTFVLQDAVKLVERTSLDRKQRPNAEIMLVLFSRCGRAANRADMKLSISFSGLGVGIAAHALMMDGVLVQITGESCFFTMHESSRCSCCLFIPYRDRPGRLSCRSPLLWLAEPDPTRPGRWRPIDRDPSSCYKVGRSSPASP
jgi:hypothetical protein